MPGHSLPADRRAFLNSLMLAGVALVPVKSSAQAGGDYPARAVRIVVPFPAGGATDMMARQISQKLSESWKQPVLVENRGGANGMLGADAVVKAQADGYTVLAATIAHAANASLFPKSPYQFESELRPVAVVGLIPLVAVVRADSPLRSLAQLATSARGGSLNAGSSGNGTAAHLALELFNKVAATRARHIPYKGGAAAMTDLLGGQVDVIFALLPEALPHLRAARLRALALTTDQRHPLLPDVPTAAEAGFPDLTVTSWNALMVPSRTSGDLVARLNADVRRVLEEPQVRARVIEQGFQPAGWGLTETEGFVSAEVARWAKLIREANIKPD
jgi:tripartite-type tricarboxylate transporter receptor subunit TctC